MAFAVEKRTALFGLAVCRIVPLSVETVRIVDTLPKALED